MADEYSLNILTDVDADSIMSSSDSFFGLIGGAFKRVTAAELRSYLIQNSTLVNSVTVSQDGTKLVISYTNGETVELDYSSGGGGLAFDSGYVDPTDNTMHLTQDGEDIEGFTPFVLPAGGGPTADSIIRIVNGLPSKNISVVNGLTANIQYSWTSLDAEETATGPGTAEWMVNGVRVALQQNVAQGSQTFDVTQYLTVGTSNTVKLTIEDSYGTTKSFVWTVTVVSYELEWNLDRVGYHESNTLALRLTPSGIGTKTVHVAIDGDEAYSAEVSTSGRTVTYTVPAQDHGDHTITAWITAVIDGETITTVPLKHVGAWTESGETDPVIALYDDAKTVKQYQSTGITFLVVTPGSDTSSVDIKNGNTTLASLTIDRTVQTYTVRPTAVGTLTITIETGEETKDSVLTVESLGYDIAPVTSGIVVDLDPTGHDNSEVDRASFGYKDGNGTNHPLTFSSNFDWINGGFKQDSDGVTAFVIKRGTTVTFDRSLFDDNAKSTGKEIKIVFKSMNVRDYNGVLMNGTTGGIGLTLQAQKAILASNLETMDIPYCQERKIELDINIESTSAHRFVMPWLKGVPARTIVYSASDSWTQDNPGNLVIGSNDCDVWIYRLKMYGNALSDTEMQDNFVADCSDPNEMLERYERNDVFTTGGEFDLNKLSQKNRKLRVLNISAERMTTGKDDKVPCTVQLMYNEGGPSKSFTATGVLMSAQGTSSLAYGAAALNLDLDFKNAVWTDGNGNTITGYALTENSLPVNYLNVKLNVASSENANNVILADDYNAYQPCITAARAADERVRDTIEGVPCAVFFTNTADSTIQVSSHTVPAGKTILYGSGDLNNSKKNFAVFGQDNETYADQCCIEISNNNSEQCRFMSDDLSEETWGEDKDHTNFEFRFPKNPTTAMKNRFQQLLTWIVSTDRAAATGDALPEVDIIDSTPYYYDNAAYRLARFRNEVQTYFNLDSLLYHYLFTERHCMVDNRAKNCFISYEYEPSLEGYRWNFNKDYDNDTAEGNDNSGGLTFRYGLEDTDVIGEANVFNAADSVLWCNIRDGFPSELAAMFQSRESAGAWSASRIIAKFNSYQSARPEVLCARDMRGKYIEPYLATGETRYFAMLYGNKEYQREQFEVYQEKYCASKYGSSLATSDLIEFRGNKPDTWGGVEPSGNMTITPYSDMYVHVRYGNAGAVKVRAYQGVPVNIVCPTNNLNDTETYIYLASNITGVENAAGLRTKKATLSSAVRLQKFAIGSSALGYTNASLTEISFANCPMLEVVDLRGATNLVQALDFSNHLYLEECYLTNTGVTGVTFANGGKLRIAYLPALLTLVAKNLAHVTAFSMLPNRLTSIWVEGCPNIDTLTIMQGATSIIRGRLPGVDWEANNADAILALIGKGGIDESGNNTSAFVLTGTADLEVVTSGELTSLATAFPQLIVSYDDIVGTHTVTFVNYDDTVLNTQTVREGGAAVDPVLAGTIQTPVKPPSVSYTYPFIGWSPTFDNVTSDLTVTAQFGQATRKFTVNWWKDPEHTVLLHTEVVDAYALTTWYSNEPEPYEQNALFGGWQVNGTRIYTSSGTVRTVQADLDIEPIWMHPVMPTTVPSSYAYLYSDDPADDSAYTLDEIYGILFNRRGRDYFNLGDKIKIVHDTNVFADQTTICRVIGFKHFKLTGASAGDASDFADVVFDTVGLMNANQVMNGTNVNAGGWANSVMRSKLNNDFFPVFPPHWRALIKTVDVWSGGGNQSADTVKSEDKLFLLSEAEVGFNTTTAAYMAEIESGAEKMTFDVFTDNASRVKKKNNGTGGAAEWWLRSPVPTSSTNFCGITGYGVAINGYASGSCGVCFGFCL